uniref:Uncharacterized protein n=1 Tax=Arundo donax TaxID=35708 RepID=A0A0A9CDW4_ARUDO
MAPHVHIQQVSSVFLTSFCFRSPSVFIWWSGSSCVGNVSWSSR